MRRVCQNLIVAGTLASVLSGCSIVVFEDGPDCPAETDCPVVAEPLFEVPEDVMELAAEPEQPNGSQPLKTQAEESQLASEAPILAPLIDGYVINFAYDSAEIRPKAIDDLKTIASFLVDKPNITLIIEGHCDERGSRDYNLALGDRRAVAVRDVLTANDIGKNRIKTVSFGKERPIIAGSTPEGWARNRRAVIRRVDR